VADATAAEQPTFDALEATTKQANEALVVENPHSSHTIERLRGLVGQLRSAIKQYVALMTWPSYDKFYLGADGVCGGQVLDGAAEPDSDA
jgi:hypothetical protein